MSKKQIKTPINVRANASAKVEAIAKASYVRKKTTTEIIPPDVTRARSNAWLDLISPLTEWAGLKGDKLRFQRTQLRLQREDVLTEIVDCARRKIGNVDETAKPIPNKFLVPFLEQASLEDLDSPLIDMWASLLASAAETFSSHHTHFVSIISQLSPRQGAILNSLIGEVSADRWEMARDSVQGLQGHAVRRTIEKIVLEMPIRTDDLFCDAIGSLFNHVGIELVHASAENLQTHEYYEISMNVDYSVYNDEEEVDYSILEAVGLIRRVETDFFDVGNWALSLVYYHLTDLGFYFSAACGIFRPADASSKEHISSI